MVRIRNLRKLQKRAVINNQKICYSHGIFPVGEKITVDTSEHGSITSFAIVGRKNAVKAITEKKPTREQVALIAEKMVEKNIVGSEGMYKFVFNNKNTSTQKNSGVWPPFMVRIEGGEVRVVKQVKGKIWK